MAGPKPGAIPEQALGFGIALQAEQVFSQFGLGYRIVRLGPHLFSQPGDVILTHAGS